MSNWRFSFIDRNLLTTYIEEPPGWDGNENDIIRDLNDHGIVFTVIGDRLEFRGEAMRILKLEYDTYGWQGKMTMVFEEDCGLGYQEFNRGKFLFTQYDFICSDAECYVTCPIENSNEAMLLKNKNNQAVDLDALIALDKTTALIPYDGLAKRLLLPSKTIPLQNRSIVETNATTAVTLDQVPNIQYNNTTPSNFNTAWFQVVPQFELVKFNEFGSFFTPTSPSTEFTCSGFYNDDKCPTLFKVRDGALTPITKRTLYFNWDDQALLYNNSADVGTGILTFNKIDLTVDYEVEFDTHYAKILYLNKVVLIRRANGSFEFLSNVEVLNATVNGSSPGGYLTGSYWGVNTVNTVTESISLFDIQFNPGDYLFVFMTGLIQYPNVQATAGLPAFDVIGKVGDIKMSTLSKAPSTTSKVYLVNEAFSRVVESITNDRLRVYSDILGRSDSQPYAATDGDGCASLEVITNGLRIRRQESRIAGTTSVFAVSLLDMQNGLWPIHNLGMGIEPDPNRLGFNRLRVESWEFFYNQTLILSCPNVGKITHKCYDHEIYSTFEFGYNKWEAEEYTGLDEFLTKRKYRTTIDEIKNEFIKLSTFISSGYAWEITRRKGNEDSKDWRFDKNTFVVCVTRTGKFHGVFDAVTNTLVMDYSGDPTPLSVGSIDIAGTIHNNGTKTVFAVTFDPSTVTFQFLSGSVVSEESYNITLPGITFPSSIFVELGNIISPSNIVDPATIYNFRISPVRNALRWMNKVLESYKLFGPDSEIIFMDGDANYLAAGSMESIMCKLESGIIKENQTINPATYADENKAKPFLMPERVDFEYPMSTAQYKIIQGNPYGKIHYSNSCEDGFGYIEKITWKPETGVANFTLIPAADPTVSGCVPVAIQGSGTLPDGVVGMSYNYAVYLYGTQPFNFTINSKPAWLTINLIGSTIFFSGTPTGAAVDTVNFNVSNCAGANAVNFTTTLTSVAPVCVPVSFSGSTTLPDGFVNTAYNFTIPLAGDAPYDLIVILKPAWMVIGKSGASITITGIPTANGSFKVYFKVQNCSGLNEIIVDEDIVISTACIDIAITGSAVIPDGYLGVAYSFDITLSGTQPFAITGTPTLPSWMTATINTNILSLTGTPDVLATGLSVDINITNCAAGSVNVTDTIDVTGAPVTGGARFGIEDNTGVQDRDVDMQDYHLQIINSSIINLQAGGFGDNIKTVNLTLNQIIIQKTKSSTNMDSGLVFFDTITSMYLRNQAGGGNLYGQIQLNQNGSVDLSSTNQTNNSDFYVAPVEIGLFTPAFTINIDGNTQGVGYVLTDVLGDGYASWQPAAGGGGGSGGAWGSITGTLSSQTDLQAALAAKVFGNTAITGATKTKITYDAKGLVTAGADATTVDIADSLDKRYVTDANLTVIGNTSGTNTGDQALSWGSITGTLASQTDLANTFGLPLSRLNTTDKTQIINAINEVLTTVNANQLNVNQRINSSASNFAQSII